MGRDQPINDQHSLHKNHRHGKPVLGVPDSAFQGWTAMSCAGWHMANTNRWITDVIGYVINGFDLIERNRSKHTSNIWIALNCYHDRCSPEIKIIIEENDRRSRPSRSFIPTFNTIAPVACTSTRNATRSGPTTGYFIHIYPLVMTNIAVENHFMAICLRAMLNYQRV